MLLNVGPDSRGLIPEADAERLLEFGAEIRRRYENPLPFTEISQDDATHWSISLDDLGWSAGEVGTELVDTAVIEEDIVDGEAVNEFRILARLPFGGKMICVYNGKTIGHKAICRFPTIRTGKITLEVISSDGEVKIKSLKAYKVSR